MRRHLSARDTAGEGISRGMLALVVLAGFMVVFGIVTAADALRGPADEEQAIAELEAREGPASGHVKIGEGSTPANGRFELYRATTADGRECFGIKLFNQPSETGLNGEALFEGCGNPSETSIGSNTGHGETIVYGRVPKHADKIKLDVPGKAQKVLKTKATDTDVPYRYFVTVYSEQLTSAKATVQDSAGKVIGSQDVPLPGTAE
jgi:hypothetical protein